MSIVGLPFTLARDRRVARPSRSRHPPSRTVRRASARRPAAARRARRGRLLRDVVPDPRRGHREGLVHAHRRPGLGRVLRLRLRRAPDAVPAVLARVPRRSSPCSRSSPRRSCSRWRSCDRTAPCRRMALPTGRVRAVAVLVVAQLAGWLVYRSVHDEPTALELTEKCLRREKLLPIESIAGDEIAGTARGGAIATRVEGNGVHVAIAKSDDEAGSLQTPTSRPDATSRTASTCAGASSTCGRRFTRPPSARRCTTAGTSDGSPASGRVASRALPSHVEMTAVLFTCAGQRVDIVSAFGRAGATTIAADLDPLAPALYHADEKALVPRVDDPGYVRALAALVAEHDVRLVVPAHRPRPGDRLRGPRRARAGARPRTEPRGVPHDGGQVPRAPVLRGGRHPEPPHLAPGRRPGRRPLPAPRQGARGVRVAPHLPRRRRRAARVPPALDPGRLDGAGALPRRGVLDRRALRPREPLPERDPALDDPVEGRRVDQGPLAPRRRADRPRRAGRRDDRHRRPGQHPVLPRAGRQRCRSPTSTRASAARSRCRSPRGAATPSSRSSSPAASVPSRGSGTSARAS